MRAQQRRFIPYKSGLLTWRHHGCSEGSREIARRFAPTTLARGSCGARHGAVLQTPPSSGRRCAIQIKPPERIPISLAVAKGRLSASQPFLLPCEWSQCARPDLDKIAHSSSRAAHRRCVRMLHPLPKNVFSSRHVSTLAITTHPPRCCEDHARLVADKPCEWQRAKRSPAGYADYGAIAIAILGRRPPGFFWLFAIRELVSNKPCVILAASWWVSGDGQCRDETR